jgi:hypothetical protein
VSTSCPRWRAIGRTPTRFKTGRSRGIIRYLGGQNGGSRSALRTSANLKASKFCWARLGPRGAASTFTQRLWRVEQLAPFDPVRTFQRCK